MTSAHFIGTIVVLGVISFLCWGAYAVIRVRAMRLEAGIGYALGCILFAPVTTFAPAAVVSWLAALASSSAPRATLFGPPEDAASGAGGVLDWVTVLAGIAIVVVTFLSHGAIAILVRYLARGAEDRSSVATSLQQIAERAAAAPAITVTTNVQSPQHAPPVLQQEPPKQIVEAVSSPPAPPPQPGLRLPQWVGEASRDGEYRTVAVEASTESDARRILESQGYFVHQLWPDAPQLPPSR